MKGEQRMEIISVGIQFSMKPLFLNRGKLLVRASCFKTCSSFHAFPLKVKKWKSFDEKITFIKQAKEKKDSSSTML